MQGILNVKDSRKGVFLFCSLCAVASRLLGRDIKITPLPLGTANNIAHLLGHPGKPLEVITGLADRIERDLDVGRVITPDGPAYFLEAMGIGMFADILEKYKPEAGKSLSRSIQTLMQTLRGYQPKFFHVNAAGQDLSGSYLLFEVMNTPTVSYHFMVAPDAKPDDGFLDLVLIHASLRESYLKFMLGVLKGNLKHLPQVSTLRARKLEIACRGSPLHLDERIVQGLDGAKQNDLEEIDPSNPLGVSKPYLSVEIVPQAVHFLLPKTNVP